MIIAVVFVVALIIGAIGGTLGYLSEKRKGEDNIPDWWPTARNALTGFVGVWIIYTLFSFYAGQSIQYQWFSQYGLTSVWSTQFWMRMTLWTIGFVIAMILFSINNVFVRLMFPKLAKPEKPTNTRQKHSSSSYSYDFESEDSRWDRWEFYTSLFEWVSVVSRIVVAVFFASILADSFNGALQFLHAQPFGKVDPVFGIDVSWYIFVLPYYHTMLSWAIWLVVASMFGAGCDYYFYNTRYNRLMENADAKKIIGAVISHTSLYFAVILAIWAVSIHFEPFRLLINGNASVPTVTGAGYVDIHSLIPGLNIFMWVLVLAAIAMVVNIFIRSWKWVPGISASAILLTALFVLGISPWLQSAAISSQKNVAEAPYIQDQINYTRWAYNLGAIQDKGILPYKDSLTPAELQVNNTALSQTRIVDWVPYLDAMRADTAVQSYYCYNDSDIDRYANIGEVMIGIREMCTNQLPDEAKNDWTSIHFRYGSGYGYTVANANSSGAQGSPNYLVNSMPPTGSNELLTNHPEVYFGESTINWFAIKTTVDEIGHPEAGSVTTAKYQGGMGIPVGTFWERLIVGVAFNDYKIIIPGNLTPESKILFDRQIYQVESKLLPFMVGDTDPYPVVTPDEVDWVHDFYTVSDNIPYSSHRNGLNYIRGSVKVVIGAYTGSFNAYVVDPTDPMLATWESIYPGLLKPAADMPQIITQHLRYGDDLLVAQADMLAQYHITDVQAFYNNQGVWQRALESTGPNQPDNAADARYVLMTVPGGNKPEFVNTVFMTNKDRINLSAWIVARSDPGHYGELSLYQFPPDVSVVGPQTVEANINQEPNLSGQISLWNQQGSQVLYGNTITTPVYGDGGSISFVYTRSIYLKAQNAAIPSIKYVVINHGKNGIYYTPTLSGTLSQLYAGSVQPVPQQTPQGTKDQLAVQLKAHADAARACLAKGDLSCFAQEWNTILSIIDQLNKLDSTSGSLYMPIWALFNW